MNQHSHSAPAENNDVFSMATEPHSAWEAFIWLLNDYKRIENINIKPKHIYIIIFIYIFLSVFFIWISVGIIAAWYINTPIKSYLIQYIKHNFLWILSIYTIVLFNIFFISLFFSQTLSILFGNKIATIGSLVASVWYVSESEVALILGQLAFTPQYAKRTLSKHNANKLAQIICWGELLTIFLVILVILAAKISKTNIQFSIINFQSNTTLRIIFLFVFLFILLEYKIFQYPYYWLKYTFKNCTLTNNPYIYNDSIVPFFFKKININKSERLVEEFAIFLIKHRPLAKNLAHELLATLIKIPLIGNYDYIASILKALSTHDSQHKPSPAWQKLNEFIDSVKTYELARQYKKELLETCIDNCNQLVKLSKIEIYNNTPFYFSTFIYWQTELKKMQCKEFVIKNPYSKGTALSPDNHTIKLLEREDIYAEFQQKILNSPTLPMLFLQGQRRVGKTSLLKYLQTILGTRYIVIIQDFDRLAGGDLTMWLNDLRIKIDLKLQYQTNWQQPSNPLDAWDELSTYLINIAKQEEKYIILAFDEYEKLQTTIFDKAPDTAQNLLWRMRAFIQEQHKVVMLFTGADFFKEFNNPSWVKVFVNQHILRIDYLSHQASLQLIEHPTSDFGLQYDDGVAENIWEITQGHPHLIHSICSELVDYANIHNQNPVTFDALNHVLKEKILQNISPFDVFWEEFCEKKAMRETIIAIANDKPIEKNSQIMRLLEHKYIAESENHQCKYVIRVPLFQQWIQQYATID